MTFASVVTAAMVLSCGDANESKLPVLMSMIEPALVMADDSSIPRDVRTAFRVHMAKSQDTLLQRGDSEPAASSDIVAYAHLHESALPGNGETVTVMIELPGGEHEIRLTHTPGDSAVDRYVGRSRDGQVSMTIQRDSTVSGQIVTPDGTVGLTSSGLLIVLRSAAATEGCSYMSPSGAGC